MHRISLAKNLYPTSFHNFSLHTNNSLKKPSAEIKCSFCRKILLGRHNTESLTLTRHQSTKAANILQSLRKKSKHKAYKKYGELLQVGEQAMTETKVQISKLKASHLSKLATSSVSLGQLHQLTNKSKTQKPVLKEVDPELLQSIKEKILKKTTPTTSKQIVLEDDQCALIFTNQSSSTVEDIFKTKQYIDMVKESYYNFRKATLYDQRLQDLRYAINEGLNQEFDLEMTSTKVDLKDDFPTTLPKSPHAVFRELFKDEQLDSYDQELMTHISNLQSQGIAHPAIDDLYDDPALHAEIQEPVEDLDIEHTEAPSAKSLNIKKAKQAIKQKKKERREARRARQELSMKEDLRKIERRGKQEALHRLLAAHLQLLCSLNMIVEGRQVLQYYRQRGQRPEHPTITDVRVYNTVLHGYASLGQLENTKELLGFMREDNITPNAQTFAAVFETIERSHATDKLTLLNHYLRDMQDQRYAGSGKQSVLRDSESTLKTFAAVFETIERSHATDKLTLLNHYLRDMQDQNITLNDLLDKSKFLYDQREVVLNAIRRIDPDFEPSYTPPVLNYDCPLLDTLKLNETDNRKGLLSSPAEGLVSLEEMLQKGKKQLEVEIKGDIEVQNIDVKDEATTNVKFYRQKLHETEEEWRCCIKQAFIRNLGTLRSQSNASHSAITLYPYLKVLEVDQFVELIMAEISKLVDGSETYSPTLKLLQRDLGTQVYQKYQIEQFRRNGVLKKIERIYEKYCEWYIGRQALGENVPLNGRQAWQLLLHKCREGASLDMEEARWPMEMRQNIGKFLYNIIINDVKIDVNMFKSKAKVKKLPAVYKVHRPWGRMVRLELKPHPALARLWSGAATPALRMRAALVPTAGPPVPWCSPNMGACLVTPTPLIRPAVERRRHARAAHARRPRAHCWAPGALVQPQHGRLPGHPYTSHPVSIVSTAGPPVPWCSPNMGACLVTPTPLIR
ncbi:DNA-directed RNA polymerase, mitochondrial [Phthorimaea operculella]|nr:DNA-directed RNA polymerase, mitochondrial [Phthorimaea operculella]